MTRERATAFAHNMQLAIEAYQVILASQAERNFGDFRYMFGQGKGYIMETTSIYIINPDTEKPVSMEAWAQDANPTRAEWIVIKANGLAPFKLRKTPLNRGRLSFSEARSHAEYLPTAAQAEVLCCPEISAEVDKALRLLGGDPMGGRGALPRDAVERYRYVTRRYPVSPYLGRLTLETYGLFHNNQGLMQNITPM